ncbi:MAG TPA: hypothetical protein VIJ72_05545 [Rhizomicrobium sp.]
MSVNDLLKRVQTISGDASIDWREIREEIHRELDHSVTAADRITLLGIFTAVMNLVERNLEKSAPDKLEEFRNIRLSDYRLMIVKEAMVGDNVCADTLYAITGREIAAGRMSSNDGLRDTAVQGVSVPHPSRDELIAMAREPVPAKARGLFSRMFGK